MVLQGRVSHTDMPKDSGCCMHASSTALSAMHTEAGDDKLPET